MPLKWVTTMQNDRRALRDRTREQRRRARENRDNPGLKEKKIKATKKRQAWRKVEAENRRQARREARRGDE